MTKRIEDVTTIGFDIDHTIYIPSINRDIPRYFCQKIAQELKCDENEIIEFYNHQNQNGNNSPQTIKKFCKENFDGQRNYFKLPKIFKERLHCYVNRSKRSDLAKNSPLKLLSKSVSLLNHYMVVHRFQ